MGGQPWSPRLQRYRDTIELWLLFQKKKNKIHTNTTVIRRLMQKLQIYEALKLSLEDVEKKLKEARQDYREARKQAINWRERFLEKLAEELAENWK